MAVYAQDIHIPAHNFDSIQKHLADRTRLDPISGDALRCWTAHFDHNIEVDIQAVNCFPEGPYTEAVIFEDGFERGYTEPDDSIVGPWHLYYQDDEYIVTVHRFQP